jgi:hypothetical protein
MEEIKSLINELEFAINKWSVKQQLVSAIEIYGEEKYLEGYKKASEDALESIKNYNTEEDGN